MGWWVCQEFNPKPGLASQRPCPDSAHEILVDANTPGAKQPHPARLLGARWVRAAFTGQYGQLDQVTGTSEDHQG